MPLPRASEGIPEDRVTKILARAAELDRTTVSLDTIRAAALEAGISSAAVDQALEEYAAMSLATPAPAVAPEPPQRFGRIRRLLRNLRRPLQLATVAFVLGIATAIGEPMIPLVLLAFVVIALRQLMRLRKSGKTGTFQVTTFLMTISICFSYMATGRGDEDVLAIFAITGIALFVGGTALISWGESDESILEESARAT